MVQGQTARADTRLRTGNQAPRRRAETRAVHTGRDRAQSSASCRHSLSQAGFADESVLHCRRLKPTAVEGHGGENVQCMHTVLACDEPRLSSGAQQRHGLSTCETNGCARSAATALCLPRWEPRGSRVALLTHLLGLTPRYESVLKCQLLKNCFTPPRVTISPS